MEKQLYESCKHNVKYNLWDLQCADDLCTLGNNESCLSRHFNLNSLVLGFFSPYANVVPLRVTPLFFKENKSFLLRAQFWASLIFKYFSLLTVYYYIKMWIFLRQRMRICLGMQIMSTKDVIRVMTNDSQWKCHHLASCYCPEENKPQTFFIWLMSLLSQSLHFDLRWLDWIFEWHFLSTLSKFRAPPYSIQQKIQLYWCTRERWTFQMKYVLQDLIYHSNVIPHFTWYRITDHWGIILESSTWHSCLNDSKI